MIVLVDDLDIKKLQDRYIDTLGFLVVIKTRNPLCVLVGQHIYRKKIKVGVGDCLIVRSPVLRQCRLSNTR